MTAAAPTCDVDLETREELRLPCEAKEGNAECRVPAERILRWTCTCIDLVCNKHAQEVLRVAARYAIRCDAHQCLTSVVSTERI